MQYSNQTFTRSTKAPANHPKSNRCWLFTYTASLKVKAKVIDFFKSGGDGITCSTTYGPPSVVFTRLVAPDNLDITPLFGRKVRLDWDVPTDVDDYVDDVQYEVTALKDIDDEPGIRRGTVYVLFEGIVSYTIDLDDIALGDGLADETVYYLNVRARGTNAESASSYEVALVDTAINYALGSATQSGPPGQPGKVPHQMGGDDRSCGRQLRNTLIQTRLSRNVGWDNRLEPGQG